MRPGLLMSRPVKTCAPRGIIADLACGKRTQVEVETFSKHVETCRDCQHVLESLDEIEDPLIENIRRISRIVASTPRAEIEPPLRAAGYIPLKLIGHGG